jgi:hypothetical protein
LGVAATGGSSAGNGKADPARVQYDADKAHCEAISPHPEARKSCMTYRGWPDGKFRR